MLNPCARKPNAPTERFLRGGLISDHEPTRRGERASLMGSIFREAPDFERLDAGSRADFTSSRPLPPWVSVLQLFLYLCDVLFSSKKIRIVKLEPGEYLPQIYVTTDQDRDGQ